MKNSNQIKAIPLQIGHNLVNYLGFKHDAQLASLVFNIFNTKATF